MPLSIFRPRRCCVLPRIALAATILIVCQTPASLPVHAQSNASDVGEWSLPSSLGFVAVHTHVLPDGNVLIWQRHDYPGGDTKARVWNPKTGSYTEHEIPRGTEEPHNDIFCSGHSMLPDGRLLVTGGHNGHLGPDGYFGTQYANIFDYATGRWSRVADMNAPRWYPSSCVLSDGEMIVLSGEANGVNDRNVVPQVWKTNSGEGWRTLSATEPSMPLYPWLHLAPNGKVFNSGPNRNTSYIDASGDGAWTPVADTNHGDRGGYSGASVMYDAGKVLIVGGDQPRITAEPYPPATNSAEVIDLNAASPTWRTVSPMNHARRHLNATLLPDGKVLVTGGTPVKGPHGAEQDQSGSDEGVAVKPAEMWDPATETWKVMASLTTPRLYHSSAVLLPDGRVLSAGGGQAVKSPEGQLRTHDDVEFFSPPYLFKGARPTIEGAPASLGYNETFTLRTPDASSITGVTLIRLPSVTHSFNQNQGFNRLSFTRGQGELRVTTPAYGGACPPGHYMLFILNGNGVPSVAKIVRVAGSNAAADFSPDRNPAGGWSYGYKATAGAPFVLYTDRSSPDGTGLNKWSSSNGSCCPAVVHNSTGELRTYGSVRHPAGLLNVHPGPNGERGMVRWTASAAGTVKIEGRFEGLDVNGTTTDVAVTHNSSATLFGGEVNGYGKVVTFSLTKNVNAGDTIDFSAGVGTNGTYASDSTGLAVNITPVPWSSGSVVNDFTSASIPTTLWSYGYRASTDSPFLPYTGSSQPCGAGTTTLSSSGSVNPGITHNTMTTSNLCGTVTIPPDMLNLHPGPNGERSVVRWKAPFAGTMKLAGKFKGLDAVGTTTDVAVRHNSNEIFARQVNGAGVEAPFSLLRAVGIGDTIEFSVGMGSNGTYYNDSTGLAVTISPAWADHVVNDFSMHRNPSGVWDYGYRASAETSFNRYRDHGTVFDKGLDTWYQGAHEPNVTRNKTGHPFIVGQPGQVPNLLFPADVISLHPGPNGERSVVRWTASATGKVLVSGKFVGLARDTTTDVAVKHNSASVFSDSIDHFGDEAPFTFSRSVAAGEVLEFSVGWGSNGNYGNDTTGLKVMIAPQ